MRILRWRAAWAVAVVILAAAWFAFAGGPSHVVQVQFGIAPEILEGADVVIDGEVVGAIERRGARTVNGFRVDPGEHSVELRVDGYGSRAVTVDTRPAGGTARVMAELVDAVDSGGASRAVVILY